MDTIEYGTAYWTERKKAGLTRVTYVGISGNANLPATIRRVTTRQVFVKWSDGRIEGVHPADIRPR